MSPFSPFYIVTPFYILLHVSVAYKSPKKEKQENHPNYCFCWVALPRIYHKKQQKKRGDVKLDYSMPQNSPVLHLQWLCIFTLSPCYLDTLSIVSLYPCHLVTSAYIIISDMLLCHHCFPSLVTCVTLVSSRVLTHHLFRKH